MYVDKGSRPEQVFESRHSNIFPSRPIFYFGRFEVRAHSTFVIPPLMEEATIGGGLIAGNIGVSSAWAAPPTL